MSDRAGLLTLPAGVPAGNPDTTAIGDPLLDVLAAYLRAAINADTKALWGRVDPTVIPPQTEPLPVRKAFTHDPDEATFSAKTLPALFVWRQAFPRTISLTQEYEELTSTIAVLWVPPPDTLEKRRRRQPFHNAFAKAIARAMRLERHPAYVRPGDTDPKAADYGTFILPALGASKIDLVDVKSFDLFIEHPGGKQEPFDAMIATIDVREILVPVKDDYVADGHVRGTIVLQHDGEEPLPLDAFQFVPTILSVTPSSGPIAGGTTISVAGHQFFADEDIGELVVTIAGARCTAVELVDGDRIVAKTPVGAVGPKDVVVTLPSGAVSAPLVGAFNYV